MDKLSVGLRSNCVVSQREVLEHFTVAETAQKLRIGRTAVYRLFRQGQLKGFQVGKTIRITAASIAVFAESGPAMKEAS